MKWPEKAVIVVRGQISYKLVRQALIGPLGVFRSMRRNAMRTLRKELAAAGLKPKALHFSIEPAPGCGAYEFCVFAQTEPNHV